MPQRKGLSQKQLDGFKKKLLKIKEDILFDISKMSGANGGGQDAGGDMPSGHGLHMADVATDMYDREFALGLTSNDRELLQKVYDALKRIEDGTYGICLKSKKPIPIARLNAIPYTEYCLEVQEEIEKERG